MMDEITDEVREAFRAWRATARERGYEESQRRSVKIAQSHSERRAALQAAISSTVADGQAIRRIAGELSAQAAHWDAGHVRGERYEDVMHDVFLDVCRAITAGAFRGPEHVAFIAGVKTAPNAAQVFVYMQDAAGIPFRNPCGDDLRTLAATLNREAANVAESATIADDAKWLKVSEVAKVLACDPSRISQLVTESKLIDNGKAFKFRRIDPASVATYQASRLASGKPAEEIDVQAIVKITRDKARKERFQVDP